MTVHMTAYTSLGTVHPMTASKALRLRSEGYTTEEIAEEFELVIDEVPDFLADASKTLLHLARGGYNALR